MTFTVPSWWTFLLLALAAWRVFKLFAEDLIIDRARRRLAPAASTREVFLTCPYCSGFWIALAWWLAWVAWPPWTLVAATPLALSASVGLIASRLDAD